MNRKTINITQIGLIAKSMNEELNLNVIYKVRSSYSMGVWFAVATSSSTVEEFDTLLEASCIAA
jgi:hypothetical protein